MHGLVWLDRVRRDAGVGNVSLKRGVTDRTDGIFLCIPSVSADVPFIKLAICGKRDSRGELSIDDRDCLLFRWCGREFAPTRNCCWDNGNLSLSIKIALGQCASHGYRSLAYVCGYLNLGVRQSEPSGRVSEEGEDFRQVKIIRCVNDKLRFRLRKDGTDVSHRRGFRKHHIENLSVERVVAQKQPNAGAADDCNCSPILRTEQLLGEAALVAIKKAGEARHAYNERELFDIGEVLLGVLQIQHAARCPDTTAAVSDIVHEDGTVVESINHLCCDGGTNALIESLSCVCRCEDVLHLISRGELVSGDEPVGLGMKHPLRAS